MDYHQLFLSSNTRINTYTKIKMSFPATNTAATNTATTTTTTTTMAATKQSQQASINGLSEPRRFTRDQIMAMARYEYARQLCVYTKAQLAKGEDLILSPSTSASSVSTNPATPPPTARMIC